jgi:hypothetical protein
MWPRPCTPSDQATLASLVCSGLRRHLLGPSSCSCTRRIPRINYPCACARLRCVRLWSWSSDSSGVSSLAAPAAYACSLINSAAVPSLAVLLHELSTSASARRPSPLSLHRLRRCLPACMRRWAGWRMDFLPWLTACTGFVLRCGSCAPPPLSLNYAPIHIPLPRSCRLVQYAISMQ